MTNDYIYYPCVSISNQTRFCPYLYSKSNNNIEKIVNIELKCENCSVNFISKDLHSHKNKIKAFDILGPAYIQYDSKIIKIHKKAKDSQ
mgnify:CR=1 FL=1